MLPLGINWPVSCSKLETTQFLIYKWAMFHSYVKYRWIMMDHIFSDPENNPSALVMFFYCDCYSLASWNWINFDIFWVCLWLNKYFTHLKTESYLKGCDLGIPRILTIKWHHSEVIIMWGHSDSSRSMFQKRFIGTPTIYDSYWYPSNPSGPNHEPRQIRQHVQKSLVTWNWRNS